MSQQIELSAELRQDVGKGASRRLRRLAGKVPGIIYGDEKDPVALTLSSNELVKAMQQEAFFSQILNVVVDGTSQQAVVRDLQRHPASERVLHIDFLRVSADRAIEVHVPLHFINETACVGVRLGGGNIVHAMIEVEVSCLPANLPEYIEVDVVGLDVNQSVHLSDLTMPEGVNVVALMYGDETHDAAVVSVQPPRGGGADVEDEEQAEESREPGDEDASPSED